MKTKGFTLIEWLIAMVIGVFLLGGGTKHLCGFPCHNGRCF
ncbi:PilW family protein [Aeromonas hydrophila]|nr:prepilin-type N-terminal cleavage/methylation domain-containing protein [Aeromonas hydrophila]